MKSKTWIKIWLAAVAAALPLLWIVNYTVDPFNVFQNRLLKYTFQINERFLRIEHLKRHAGEYDSYMLGSSRIGTTLPATVEAYIPGSKFYNFTVPSANLYDHLMHLKYFLKQGYPLKNLYLQVDIDNMSLYGRIESDYVRKMHPEVVGESSALFYLDYLSGFFPFNIKRKLRCNKEKRNYIEYAIDTTGVWSRPEKERKAAEDCKAYVAAESSFHEPRERSVGAGGMAQSIKALEEIRDLCREHGIGLYLFTMAHNQSMMDTFKREDYLNFIAALAEVTDFYDFSGYNSVTTNNCNYYEWSHYRPYVGEWIAARIFGDRSVEVPQDFGVHVDRNNVAAHLETLRRGIDARDAR